jgi:hypothetical protein
VLLLNAPQHLQLSPLNINLQQVNTPADSSATCQHYTTSGLNHWPGYRGRPAPFYASDTNSHGKQNIPHMDGEIRGAWASFWPGLPSQYNSNSNANGAACLGART